LVGAGACARRRDDGAAGYGVSGGAAGGPGRGPGFPPV